MKKNDSALFFTCSLIELIGRTVRRKRREVVEMLGPEVITRIYTHAGVLHCEPIAKNAEIFIEMCKITQGDFDNVAACKYPVPDYWSIGKVYARLIEDTASEDVTASLIRIYSSPISDAISNYNSDLFYQSRDYIKEFYLLHAVSCADL